MYNSDTTPIFTNFNFKINPGEKVAITGPTGSGKSTLIKLINCLLTPQHGEILFDDTPANQIEKNHFKKSITTLNSQPFFFKDSIKNNLKLWNDSISDLQMFTAAKKAQIHKQILNHGGYETKISNNETPFSSGEKQLLNIAIALLQKPKILILNQATSALDFKTELNILSTIFQEQFTCIIISNEKHIIQNCDKIITLKLTNT